MPDAPPAPPMSPSHDPVAQTLALLQPWIEYVPQQQRRLGLFICLALAFHAALFFFLRIDLARAELQRVSRTHVSVDYPQALAVDGQGPDRFWDDLTDPRLFLQPSGQADLQSGESPPVPLNSAMAAGTLPEPAPPPMLTTGPALIQPVEEQVAGALNPPRIAFVYDQTPLAMATKTTWQWDDALAARAPANVADLPSPVSDTDLSPTKLLVAVDSRGTVQHVLVEQGSGQLGASGASDLDQEAVLAARKIRFRPSDALGQQWGRITVYWRYAAKPREEIVPTPPSTQ